MFVFHCWATKALSSPLAQATQKVVSWIIMTAELRHPTVKCVLELRQSTLWDIHRYLWSNTMVSCPQHMTLNRVDDYAPQILMMSSEWFHFQTQFGVCIFTWEILASYLTVLEQSNNHATICSVNCMKMISMFVSHFRKRKSHHHSK